MVEQLIRNEQVVGSTPTTGSILTVMNLRLFTLLGTILITLMHGATPKSSDGRIKVELIAEAPKIVTPTGVGVDTKGRVLVIESHTHFRPKDYNGPERDRVLMFTIGAKGKAKRTVFFEGLLMGMDVAVGKNDWVYLAERSRILRVRDTNDNGNADKAEDVIVMDTNGTYPHNGLSGLSFDTKGNLIFGLGENLGHAYTMIGRDKVKINGAAGIGGGVFRCTADGNKLEQIARGFWNPFGICVDPWGRIFAVDNDPGSSPPCRLLHVVPGGDYGYQYQHGRRGIHPFLAWDGELTGTLPMVHGTGEAPCEVIHFNSPMFANKYRGELLSTSWGDHRIERYRLKRRGASVTATMEPMVQGDDSFRPVGMAVAPDGSLFVSDWGSSSYNLNHKGRLWRISSKTDEKPQPLKPPPYVTQDSKRLQKLCGASEEEALPILLNKAQHNDRFVQSAALYGLRHHIDALLKMSLKNLPTGKRIATLHALKESRRAESIQHIPTFLADPQPSVRFEAARWIADHQLKKFRPAIESALRKGDYNYSLFRSYLACLDALDERKNPDRINEEFTLPLLKHPDTPDSLRAHVLRYLPGGHKALTRGQLTTWLKSKEQTLQHEAVWKMRYLSDDITSNTIRTIARDEKCDPQLRLTAVAAMGLGDSPDTEVLMQIATGKNVSLRDESLRSLIGAHLESNDQGRLTKLASQHISAAPAIKRILGHQFVSGRPAPSDTVAWLKRLDALPGKADAKAGERIFFNQKIALCGQCHRQGGRGTRVGPDLTVISRRNSPQRLLESILQPSKEVAPYMRPWTILMNDDSVHTGIALRRGGNSEVYLGLDGMEIRLDKLQIKSKTEGRVSLMPEGLALSLTDHELRNLLAFLMARR